MKVGLVTAEYEPMQGGVGDFTREVGKALAALDTKCTSSPISTARSAIPHPGRQQPLRRASDQRVGMGMLACAGPGRTAVAVGRDQYPIPGRRLQDAPGDQLVAPGPSDLGAHPPLSSAAVVVTFHDLKVPYLFPKAARLRWQTILALARYTDGVIVTNRKMKRRSIPLSSR